MTTPTTRVLTLRIEDPAAQIRGTVDDERGARREFSGWLGLARALELTLGPEQVAAENEQGAPRGAPLDLD